MTKYNFYAAIGETDFAQLGVTNSGNNFCINLMEKNKSEGRHLKCGAGSLIADLQKKRLYPTEDAIDLLLLAMMVFAADTFIERESSSQDGWTREINVDLPVHQPEMWENQSDSFRNLLKFLTGDFWDITFRPRPKGRVFVQSSAKRRTDDQQFISLFSGGLDSLIGAIDRASQKKSLLLIGQSISSDWITIEAQNKLSDKLNNHFKNIPIEHMRAGIEFYSRDFERKEHDKENTQRSRSFLFYSIANLVGSCFNGSKSIWVPENGLISLNVPLDFTRLGALSTRTVHPFTLGLMNSILQNIGSNCQLENPYQFKTKGEMVRGCMEEKLLKKLFEQSMSCSHPYAVRFEREEAGHCGYCVPCLIRRASLMGMNDKTPYFKNILDGRCLDTSKAEGRSIRSFQLMIDRLQKNPNIEKLLIHKPGPLDDADGKYADMFHRGIMEVAALLEGVKVGPSK